MLEKLFKLKENKTDVRTEVVAGITTFMTMAYILAVDKGAVSSRNESWSSVYGDGDCGMYRYFAHGSVCKLSVCTCTGNGTECILCIYGCTEHGIHMGGGACSCICGRNYFYSVISYECA